MLDTPHQRFQYIVKDLIYRGRLKNKSAVARAIGIDPTNLPKYMEDDGREPNPDMLCALAKLGYSINWYFLGGPVEERLMDAGARMQDRAEADRMAWLVVRDAAERSLKAANERLELSTDPPESDTSNQFQP